MISFNVTRSEQQPAPQTFKKQYIKPIAVLFETNKFHSTSEALTWFKTNYHKTCLKFDKLSFAES